MKNTITEEKKWKVLKSEYIFKRPGLTARSVEVQLTCGVVEAGEAPPEAAKRENV